MATIDTSVAVLYESKFTQIFEFITQQMDARLPQVCRQGNHKGSKGAQAIKQFGKVSASVRTARLTPIVFTDVPLDARWVYPTPLDLAVPFDTWDELMTSADPKSGYVTDTLSAMNRQKDLLVINSFFNTANTGQTGSETTAFPSSNVIGSSYGASGATGLTKTKLEQAIQMLIANEVDLEADRIFCVITAKQWKNLMDETTFINNDYYKDSMAIVTGKLQPFLGANFIHSEQLPLNGSSERMVPVFAGTGMHWGIWQDVETKISIRNDLRGQPWQCYTSMYAGATRLQENKVIQVACAEV